jgi:hypothetical protein
VIDAFVLLTPFLVLGVVLLLGFAGCSFELPEPPPPPQLTLVGRVPSSLTILRSRFEVIEPGSTFLRILTDLVRTDDGSGTVVLSFVITEPTPGTWTATFKVQVSDGTRQQFTEGTGTFIVDEGSRCSASFEVSGSPSTNDLKTEFVGLICEG